MRLRSRLRLIVDRRIRYVLPLLARLVRLVSVRRVWRPGAEVWTAIYLGMPIAHRHSEV